MKRFFLLASILLFSLGCKQQKTEVEEPDIQALRKEVKPTEVQVAKATYRPFEFLVNATGNIASERELKINFESSGYLEKLNVENGQRVKKGQVIGQLKNEKEQFALERAQISYDKARVLYMDDSTRRSSYNETAINTMELSSGLKDARLALREARIALQNTIIKAPIDGIIVDLEAKQGSLVSGGSTMCSIYDPDNLTLTAKVLETDFRFIKQGLKADIFPLSKRDQSFLATVTEINPKVDEYGMIQVKLKLDETQGLLPGMNANAVIHAPQAPHIIAPRESVVIKSGRTVIFTLENGLAKWKYVEIGLDNGVDVEVLDGLEDGSTVILTNNIQLAHDAAVSIANLEDSNK